MGSGNGNASPGASWTGLIGRVLALAVLWVGLNAWTRVHLGYELTELSLVNAVVLAFAGILAMLPESQRQEAQAERRKWRERLVSRLLDGRMLLALYLVCVVAGSFVSSVRVEAAGVEGERTVRLAVGAGEPAEETEEALRGGDDVLRFVRFTTYAGRDLRVEVEGVGVEDGKRLRPWLPSVIRADRIERPPVAYLGLPLETFSLLDGATLHLLCADGSRVSRATTPGRAVMRVGPGSDEVDEAVVESWRVDLAALPEALAERAAAGWSRAVAAPEPPCWQPGETIRALLCTYGGTLAANARFEVMGGVQHHLLERISENASDSGLCADSP